MANEFSEWLLNELNKRKWTQKELAKKSGLSPSTICYIINHQRGLGLKSVNRMAQALGIPEDVIINKFENYKTTRKTDEIISEADYILRGLPIRDKKEILAFIQLKRQIAEEYGEYKTPEK